MYFNGLIVGMFSFLIIGGFHPIVIKSEYYFGSKIWPIFLVSGLLFIFCSLSIKNTIFSILTGIIGFTCLWSIHEIKEQESRVRKGWFPSNPKKNMVTKR